MTAVELHRPLAVERIGAHGLDHAIVADAGECAAIARRLGVPAVHALSCRFHLHAAIDGMILAEGDLTARLVRVCVVSLDPFETEVAEHFRVRFVPEGSESDDGDPESDDEIPYRADSIDLGEAAVEQLALGLEPYPKKPGAVLPGEPGEAVASAFAALARLRRPQ
jgi:uncharacterized metal-binding protein YceD (DUF177 family)